MIKKIIINKKNALQEIKKLEWFVAPWTTNLWKKVIKSGGFINSHCHLDRVDTCQEKFFDENIKSYDIALLSMRDKQIALKQLREKSHTTQSLRKRMTWQIERSIQEGVKEMWASTDTTPDLISVKTAQELKIKYKNKIRINIGAYAIMGFKNPDQLSSMEAAAGIGADFFLGLPELDEGTTIGFEGHVKNIFNLGFKYKKPIQIHVDQSNTAYSQDAFRIIKCLESLPQEKIDWFRDNGNIWFIHLISPSCYTKDKLDKLVSLLVKYNIGVIVCPRAALSMMHLRDEIAPIHVSMAPVFKLLDYGIRIGIGTDNTHDPFIPSGKGLIVDELSIMAEMLRFYDTDILGKLGMTKRLDKTDQEKIRRVLSEIKKASEKVKS